MLEAASVKTVRLLIFGLTFIASAAGAYGVEPMK